MAISPDVFHLVPLNLSQCFLMQKSLSFRDATKRYVQTGVRLVRACVNFLFLLRTHISKMGTAPLWETHASSAPQSERAFTVISRLCSHRFLACDFEVICLKYSCNWTSISGSSN